MSLSVSYPNPVLGNADDVTVGTIDPAVSFTVTDEAVQLDLTNLSTSNATLDEMLRAGRAAWAIRVQCARTYFRSEFQTSDRAHRLTFRGDDLDGRVDVEIALFAASSVGGYSPEGLHSDYGEAVFDLQVGAVIGVGPVFSFDVDKEFDPLRAPVSSLMRLTQGDFETGPFRLDLGGELLEVFLSKEDYARLGAIKDKVPGVLHAALVLPVLTEALTRLASSNGSEFAGQRWADRLLAIVEGKAAELTEAIGKAQAILEGPLSRAFGEIEAVLERDY